MGIENEVGEILDGFVEIGNDHPRAVAFEEAVREQIAARPSPTFELVDDGVAPMLRRISEQLDTVIELLREGDS